MKEKRITVTRPVPSRFRFMAMSAYECRLVISISIRMCLCVTDNFLLITMEMVIKFEKRVLILRFKHGSFSMRKMIFFKAEATYWRNYTI